MHKRRPECGRTDCGVGLPCRTLLGFGLLLLAFAATCLAQKPRFQADVTNIHIEASVSTGTEIVAGLKQSDFVVSDEGEAQPIVAFAKEALPLSMVFLLDLSGSMHRDLAELASIARGALEQLRPGDRVAVVRFSVDAFIEQAFTSDRDELAAAIRRTARRDLLDISGTRIVAPIRFGLKFLSNEAENQQQGFFASRAIVVITDNLPMAPLEADDAVIRRLLEADIVLHAIVVHRQHVGIRLPPPRNNPQDPRYTQENVFHIAGATGGEALISARMKDSFPEMLARIRTRYGIWYRPPKAQAGTYRRITVSLSEEAQRKFPNAVVRAREGYYAR